MWLPELVLPVFKLSKPTAALKEALAAAVAAADLRWNAVTECSSPKMMLRCLAKYFVDRDCPQEHFELTRLMKFQSATTHLCCVLLRRQVVLFD